MISPGFWLTPAGEMVDVTTRSHVSALIDNPCQCGLTTQAIRAVYRRYREPLYQEGAAREDLIRAVVKSGFVRIRLYPNRYWSITIHQSDESTMAMIRSWAKQVCGYRYSGKYMDVKLFETSTNTVSYTDISGLVD